MDLKSYIAERRATVEAALEAFLPPEDATPPTLHRAMRHAVFAGGKRLRPILCLAAAEACAGRENLNPDTKEEAVRLGCALELLHTFSLVHDDLPCMDDDDFRRGQPTVHKVFGEDVAVLAGDALQALAMELCAMSPTPSPALELARTAGSHKLIAGQIMDMEGEGKNLGPDALRAIHEGKTAALLTTSVRLGGLATGAPDNHLAALSAFGRALGLAFQIIDDILDVTQPTEKLGKSAGKDEAADKTTYPKVLGLEPSRQEARRLTAEATAALAPFGDSARRLREIAQHMLEREY